jgi:hypothetical protein
MDELMLIVNENCDHNGGQTRDFYRIMDHHFVELLEKYHGELTQEDYDKLVGKAYDHSFDYFKLVVSYNQACINWKGLYGSTILHTACEYHPQKVKFLLDHGADVNAQTYYNDIHHGEDEPNGYSPIVAADRWGRQDIVALLLEYGAIDNREEYKRMREEDARKQDRRMRQLFPSLFHGP